MHKSISSSPCTPVAVVLSSPKANLCHGSVCKMSPLMSEPQQDSEYEVDKQQDDEKEFATSVHRDEIVAAILTIASALGLARETLHLCVDLLDRYMQVRSLEASRLETLSIACLWIAVKFMETPTSIVEKSIKKILQQRRHSGNWTWKEIIEFETHILQELNFRIMAPTVLGLLQKKIHSLETPLASEKVYLAYYFADLFLLKDRARQYAKELLVEAVWYVVSGHNITNVQPPLLAPVVILFLAHRDNINPKHHVFKTWFALRCQYGAFLPAPWQVPYDPYCICRVCENVQNELMELEEASA
uniref:Cyclin-like domain-containing protein n=1 Tax=Globisporangium ultimum (strain ATCC 200006 / CBS 805.95 / DAOM BR144) TaxID=431595 RepID=K3W777_GLOUD